MDAKKNIKLAVILVTSLFFLWGVSYGLLDVMNKNLQTHLGITKANSGLLQMAYFGAYFVIAIPAAKVAEIYSYKYGIVMGLLLYAVGCLLIIPASNGANFYLFLFAFFVIACGLGALETNANPYITKLGDDSSASFRINLAQSFNGIGQFVGPILGGYLFLAVSHGNLDQNMSNVQSVYVGIAIFVVLVMLVFILNKMPEIRDKDETPKNIRNFNGLSLYSYKHYRYGVLTQFLYIAAQVGSGAFFVNYAVEHWPGINDEYAAYLFSGALISFMLGRVLSTPIMKFFPANKLLGIYAAINVFLLIIVSLGINVISVFALLAVFFFMSISFPTIFSLSLMGLPANKVKKASSFLIMSIVGGALMPFIMGWVADISSISISFVLLIPCFITVSWYGFYGSIIKG